MTLCWGLLILEDNENGCVIYNGRPKDTFNTNILSAAEALAALPPVEE